MQRVARSLAGRPRLAGLLMFLVALVVAACKGGGSSGY